MRKKDETLHNTILDLAREMAHKTGPDSINIRTLADRAGIAAGTVYNYFSSKDDILLALTEEYWRNTLIEMHEIIKEKIFYKQLEEIYAFLSERIMQSAGMLMGSLSNVQAVGRDRMQNMQQVLCSALIKRMENDVTIRNDIWSETFSMGQYANFIIMNIMMLLQMKVLDIGFFIEIVKRTLYK